MLGHYSCLASRPGVGGHGSNLAAWVRGCKFGRTYVRKILKQFRRIKGCLYIVISKRQAFRVLSDEDVKTVGNSDPQ